MAALITPQRQQECNNSILPQTSACGIITYSLSPHHHCAQVTAIYVFINVDKIPLQSFLLQTEQLHTATVVLQDGVDLHLPCCSEVLCESIWGEMTEGTKLQLRITGSL